MKKEGLIATATLIVAVGTAIASLAVAIHTNNKKEDYKLRKEIIADCLEMVGDKKEMSGAYRHVIIGIVVIRLQRIKFLDSEDLQNLRKIGLIDESIKSYSDLKNWFDQTDINGNKK